MMERPALGYYLPCRWVYNRDGASPVVLLRNNSEITVRLIDCWVDDNNKAINAAAKIYLDRILENTDGRLAVGLTLIRDANRNEILDVTDILKTATFDRWPGRLWLEDSDIGALMVDQGFATVKRPTKKK